MIVGLIYFYALAALSVIGALITVTNKNPIRGAMGLLVTVVSIGGLFLALHAEFLAAVQLIVYAGAIVVLFLFVIMLLGPSAVAPPDRRGVVIRSIGAGAFSAAAVGAGSLLFKSNDFPRPNVSPHDFGTIDALGHVLFSDAVVPFELSSALLIVAVVGAVAIARGKQADPTMVDGGQDS